MAATRQLAEFKYKSGASALTAWWFTVQVDDAGLVAVRDIESPVGPVTDTYTGVPQSVMTDIQTAISDVETLLATTSAINGTATFAAEVSKAIAFATALGSTNYRVHLEVPDFIVWKITNKLVTGFTIQLGAKFTGTVGYDVFI